MSFQSVGGGVGLPASDLDSRRRQQLAQLMLQSSNASPAVGWTGALNKVLSGALAGYNIGKDAEEQTARADAKNETLANALRAGQGQAAETKQYGDTTINWNERKADPNQMAAILMGNQDTAGMGMQMQFSQMDNKAKAEAELAKAARESEQRQREAWNKPMAVDGAIVVPSQLDPSMGGFTPQAAAPPVAPTSSPNPPPIEPLSHTPGYATQVASIENGTGNPAARNPNSSAMGNGQFIDATWLDIMKRNRPDLVQGKSDRDILALRADPKLSAEMTDVYGMENADFLQAGGIQNVGNAEKYAAHFFGPSGAIKVLKADPNAPLSSVLSPEVIQANPHLARLTAGQWRQQNATKFAGGAQSPAPPQGVQVASPVPAAPPNQPGVLYKGQGKGVRDLNPEELKQLGYSKDAHVQQDRDGRIHVVRKGGEGEGGGPYGGPSLSAQDRNIVYNAERKMMNGETLTPEERWQYETSKRSLEAPRTFVGPDGVTTSTPSAMPSMHQSGAAVPNPAAPSNQPTITVVQKKVEKPSNEQNLNAGFANRLNMAMNIFDKLEREDYVAPSLTDRGLDKVPGINGYLTSDEFQQMDQARREFINAQLRRESGASISPQEFENANRQYFPQPGEGADVIAQKRVARELAVANMAQSAGPAEINFKPKPTKQPDAPKPPAGGSDYATMSDADLGSADIKAMTPEQKAVFKAEMKRRLGVQ